MPKVWEIKPQITDNILDQLIYNRGLKSEKEIDEFFNPSLELFQKELEITGIPTAKKRILEAVKNQEQIVAYGDYDVDGICGAAILYLGLTTLGAKVLPYIPHREKEGYGLSKFGLDQAFAKGASLVITVDNGIVSHNEADYAKSLGIDLIITDHHIPLDTKPEVLSIVHSTKMSGASVAWCLINQLVEKDIAEDLLDLVAIATICDILPLVGLNRAFVYEGLKVLNQTKKVGLLALLSESKIQKGEVGAYQIGHVLGPRINAIGRLEHSIEALRLLCTKDKEKARDLARLLCASNDLKKKITEDAILQAREMIKNGGKDNNVLVMYSKEWVPGIIGLVAGRMCDEYKLPAIAISQGDTHSKGSARSVNGLDIVGAIRKCSDLLLDIGGHPKAAGFTIETEKIEIFKTRLEELLGKEELDTTEKLIIETEVPSKKITKKLISDIEKLEPTGDSNPRPIFATFNMRLSDLRVLSEGQHLKFKADGIDAIAFSFGPLAKIIKEGQLVNLAYYLEMNKFNGSEKLQLKILDIQLN